MPHATLAYLIAALLVFGQAARTFTRPGVWRAREAFSGDLAHTGATAAETKTVVSQMDALRALIMAAPAVVRPVGYNASLSGYLTEFLVPERPDLKGRDYPFAAGLWFGAFPQEFRHDGGVSWGETTLMGFNVNEMPRWQSLKARDWKDVTTDVVLHPVHYRQGYAGLPRFGDLLVLKKNPKQLWMPVTLRETVQLVVAQRKKDVATFEEGLARAKKEHEAWSEEQKRSGDELYQQQLAKLTPTADRFWADAVARLSEADPRFATTPNPAGCPTNLALLRSLDWEKMKTLMDK